jgi:hypothetical protein
MIFKVLGNIYNYTAQHKEFLKDEKTKVQRKNIVTGLTLAAFFGGYFLGISKLI